MQVTKYISASVLTPARVMTADKMQFDFEYEMAQRFARSFYEKGLISVDELNRLSALNKEKFSPFYGDIMG